MELHELHLPEGQVRPGQDAEISRAVEAGVYAEHLLATRGPDPELDRIVALGRSAQQRMWSTGLRIAMQQALRAATLHRLPAEELFQDACVAVAEAIYRYDHTRGARFTTFTFDAVLRVLADGVRHRVGRPVATRWDRRAARRVAAELEARGVDGSDVDLGAAAAAAGASVAAAQRAMVRLVSLDEAVPADPAATAPFDRIASHGLGFLELLSPRDRRVLELRFGLGTEPLTLAAAAQRLGTSSSTVFRWEREAIAAARALLEEDRTAIPASGRSPRLRSSTQARPAPRTPRRAAG